MSSKRVRQSFWDCLFDIRVAKVYTPGNHNSKTLVLRACFRVSSGLLTCLVKNAHPKELAFRADAAFAKPEVYEALEVRGVGYAIRIPANDSLERDIAELLSRPAGSVLNRE